MSQEERSPSTMVGSSTLVAVVWALVFACAGSHQQIAAQELILNKSSASEETFLVLRVVDSKTLIIKEKSGTKRIRLMGVGVSPNESLQKMRKMLTGSVIYVVEPKQPSLGSPNCYCYGSKDRRMINLQLVASGLTRVNETNDFEFKGQFLNAQEHAKKQLLGLWSAATAKSAVRGSTVSGDTRSANDMKKPTKIGAAEKKAGRKGDVGMQVGPFEFGANVDESMDSIKQITFISRFYFEPNDYEGQKYRFLPPSVEVLHLKVQRPDSVEALMRYVKSFAPLTDIPSQATEMHLYFKDNKLYQIKFGLPFVYINSPNKAAISDATGVNVSKLHTQDDQDRMIDALKLQIKKTCKPNGDDYIFKSKIFLYLGDTKWKVDSFGPDTIGIRDVSVLLSIDKLR